LYTALPLKIPPPGITVWKGLARNAVWVVMGVFAPEAMVYTTFVQLRTVLKFRAKLAKALEAMKTKRKAKG